MVDRFDQLGLIATIADDVEKVYSRSISSLAAKYVNSSGQIEVQYRFVRSAAFTLYLDALEFQQK